MSSSKFRLILDVTYNLNGDSAQEMSQRLQRAAAQAIGEGLLTGSASAEVGMYTIQVAETPPPLSEEDLAAFMLKRIEDGHLELGDIPVRLARYGLQEPGDFVSEMRERMVMSEDERDVELDHDDGEHQHAWSITARLAALSPSSCAGVSSGLASLIEEARGLHPSMVRSERASPASTIAPMLSSEQDGTDAAECPSMR